jgi:hypothetical protein
MDSIIIDKLSANQLAQLLVLDEKSPWVGNDSAEILKEQLLAPALPDLETVSAISPEIPAIRQLFVARQIPLDRSFLDHMTAPVPVLEMLQLIKEFARHTRDDMSSPLRGTSATVLYFGAIAAAWRGCKAKITQISNEQLRERFAWAARQKGAEQLSALFAAAAAALPQAAK